MIGGIIDAVVGAATNKRDYNRSVSQYKDQYQLQKEQFYNPMQHRVADLKKAGLHPSLAAGMTSGQVVSNPAQSLPQQPNTNIAGVLQSKKLQNDLLAAQIENVKAQTDDIRANTPIKGQTTSIHDAQALGTKLAIEKELDPMTKAVGKYIGDQRNIDKDQHLLYSPAQMKQEGEMYGDEVVEVLRGVPNFMYNHITKAFMKYGKGRSFTEFVRDNSSIIRALTRTPNVTGRSGRGRLKKLKNPNWR